MADAITCPPPDELSQMLLGRLPAPRSAQIESHLDTCDRCLSVVKGLRIESQIVDLFKAHPWDETPHDPIRLDSQAGLEQLMTQLEDMCTTDGLRGSTRGSGGSIDPQTDADLPRLAPAENPGEMGRLAHFRVLSLLGAGGMGVVYLAEDIKLRRAIALKVMRPRYARDADAHDRFLREARTIAAIKHDHVVVIHEVGEVILDRDAASTPYLAMERLEGVNLQAWMNAHPRPPLATVVRLGRHIAEALAALHARGLVHRDVKPANLWLERIEGASRSSDAIVVGANSNGAAASFRLKLLDFGLALSSTQDAAERRALGTPAYMSPEQLRGEPVDARSDLFSLGCVLYELCTGELPFPDRRFIHDVSPPMPVYDFNPNIPPRLARLVGGLLEDNAQARPESARKVAHELMDVEKDLSGSPRWGRRAGVAAVVAAAALLIAVSVDSPLRRWLLPTLSPKHVDAGPLDDPWCQEIQKLEPKRQFNAVVKKLTDLNPGYDAEKVAGWIEPDVVLRFHEKTDHLTNIEPIRCLVDLKTVSLRGSAPGKGQLADIGPLHGLRLSFIELHQNPKLRDLSPLRGLPLKEINVSDTAVDSLADLAEMSLEELKIARTPVHDLGPLHGMSRLRLLNCQGCPIESLEPLVGTPIAELTFDFDPARDTEMLKRLTSLKKINGGTAADFWAKNGSR